MSLNLDKSAWKRVAFGDVVRNLNNTVKDPAVEGIDRVIAMEHLNPGELKINRWGSIEDGTTFTRRVKPGQTLFGKRRAYQRKAAYAEFDAITSGDILVFEADPTQLLPEFLPFLVQSDGFYDHALGTSAGSLSPRTNWRDLSNYEFDLPPLDEQQRLADLFWALERYGLSIRERADRAWDAAAVVLRHAWEAERKVPLGDIGECVTGSTPSKANADYWNSEDVPFYTPSEIDGEFIASARQRVSLAGAKAGRMLPRNAVAVACIGGDLGKSAVVVEPGISNQQITSVIGLPADDAELLQAVLAHPLGRAALQARETTTIVRKLNKSDLMKVEVPWPADRTTLHAVVRARRTATVGATDEASRLATLRSGLTAEIFGGAE
ncbi:restriction endonuclease subunit S [Streptomyces sp. NPDC051207]|uniref:restriction endonuclease subunit S n=1 Tax=Streptomyces sp. NPDC051207 TaxID=3154641 RepID=UPI00343EA1D4